MGIDVTGGALSQQFGALNINIEKLISLTLGLKTSSDEKMRNIFEMLKNQPNIPNNHYRIIVQLIDACKCKTYTSTRFSSLFSRQVVKTSHVGH